MPQLKVDLVVDDKGSLVVTGFGKKVDKVMYSSRTSVASFGKELAVAGAGMTALLATGGMLASQFITVADSYTLAENKLKLVTKSSEDLVAVEDELYEQAKRSHASYTESVNLYSRFARALEKEGTSKEELLRITETLNKANIISGATQQEAAGSMLQLSQAMASGVLRGQEYNSISEQSSRVTKILSDYLRVNTGELRAKAKQGEITSQVMVAAFGSAAAKIDAEFLKMDVTVAQAVTDFKTVFNSIIDGANDSSGATYGLSDAIQELSSYMEDHRDDIVGYFGDGLEAGKSFGTWLIGFGEEAKPALGNIKDGLSGIYSLMQGYKEIGGIGDMEWGIVGYALLRGGPQAALLTAALLEINNQLTVFGLNIGSLKGDYDGMMESIENLYRVAKGELDWDTGAVIPEITKINAEIDEYTAKIEDIESRTGVEKLRNFWGGGAEAVTEYKNKITELQVRLDELNSSYASSYAGSQADVSGLASAESGIPAGAPIAAVVPVASAGAGASGSASKTNEEAEARKNLNKYLRAQASLVDDIVAGEATLERAVLTESQAEIASIRDKYAGYDQLIQQQINAGNQTKEWGEKTHAVLGVRMQEDLDALNVKSTEVANEMQDAFVGWANGMSGSLTEMVWSAELSFASILESFGKMLTQMVIQYMIVEPLLNAMFGGGSVSTGSAGMTGGVDIGIAHAASGYDVPAGASPITRLHEKEMVLPQKYADVIRNGSIGGGSTTNVIINNNGSKSQASATEVQNADGGKDIVVMIEDVVGNSIMSGRGKINKAMRSTFGATNVVVGR